ncbi:MAG TPA: TetR/AcrR family transcriptional regulator [Thermoleophilaceae bacterium]
MYLCCTLSYNIAVLTAATEPLSPLRQLLAASPRGRLLGALAACVLERGYAATTVTDVVARASMSKATFYTEFADKEDCFVAALELAAELVLQRVTAAMVESGDAERLERGIVAYLDALAEEPDLARCFVVEGLAAGERAARRQRQLADRFADILDAPGASTPPLVRQAVIGGIDDVVRTALRDGRPARLADLRAPLTEFARRALTPPDRSD